MRLVVLRRVLFVAALGAVLAHAACSNEQDLNPQPLPPGSGENGGTDKDKGARGDDDDVPSGAATSGFNGGSSSGGSSSGTNPSSSSGSVDAGPDADSGDR
jgi:hypothetical protein